MLDTLVKVDALHAKAERDGISEKERLQKACQGFEALFFNTMLKAMRASENDSGLIPKSRGEKIFTEMLDEQYSEMVASKSRNGLADIMYEQLKTSISAEETSEKMLSLRIN